MSEIREVHTHTDSGGGTASGMLLGIVLVVLVLAVAAFVFFGNVFTGGTTTPTQPSNRDTNIQINPPSAPPSKVEVEIKPPAEQQAPSQQQAPANKP